MIDGSMIDDGGVEVLLKRSSDSIYGADWRWRLGYANMGLEANKSYVQSNILKHNKSMITLSSYLLLLFD